MNEVEFFRMVDVRGIDQLIRFWPFLLEGLTSLNAITSSSQVDKNTLFRVCVDVATLSEDDGMIAIVMDKSTNQPLSYTISFNNSHDYKKEKALLVYAIYSNRKSRTATRYGLNHVAEWAKSKGYDELHGNSPRITGAAVRLFENIFGFRKQALFLVRKL